MRLSACLIVRDEAVDLPRALASLDGAVDEIVVVDTGSRDPTPEIARAAGARVIEIEWPNDFAAARNRAIDEATGDWCLSIDADEELATPRVQIDPAAHGMTVTVRNLMAPGELAAWHDSQLVRLFRRAPELRYEGRIHEQISPAIARVGGTIAASTVQIVHHGYARTTAQGGVDRAKRNLALLAEALRATPDDAYLLYQLGATEKAAGDAAAGEHLARALAHGGLSTETAADAHMKLAQLALAAGDDARAIELARACLALVPNNVTALQTVVVGCATLGRLAEARTACRALLACANLSTPSRNDLEQLLQALGG